MDRRPFARIMARLDEPHSRLTRTTRRNLVRLALWPLGAVWAVVTVLGFCHPDAFTGSSDAPGPSQTPPAATTGPTPTPPPVTGG